jgi:cytochrome oxidase Cu insertion factor (SCO1/SenC/PrrC family)
VIEAAQAEGARRPRPATSRVALVLAWAAFAGVGIGVALHLLLGGTDRAGGGGAAAGSSAPATVSARAATGGLRGEATWAAGAAAAPAISALRDQSGHRFTLSSLHGHTVVLAFVDSHCNQACPLEGRAIAAAERAVPARQGPVNVLVSVNPRDTPASVRSAARRWGLAAGGARRWHWLMGTHAELARVWRDYRIFVAPPRNGDIVHTEAIYLVDRRGFERSGYVFPFASRFVSSDLRVLARARG